MVVFAPIFWEGGGGIQIILCESVSLVSVVGVLLNGGDT